MIKWDAANKAKLEMLFEQGLSDIRISEAFGTINKYAIGKQRSIQGLVSVKKCKHTRAAKTLRPPVNVAFSVLYYQKDGQPHFMYVDDAKSQSTKNLAKNLILKQDITEVITLRPVAKLVMQGITEVKL